MKHAVAVATLLLATSFALAQVEPDAATLLNCAAERHGLASTAFRNSVDRGTITYFGPTGEPVAALEVDGIIDIEHQRLRVDFFIGETLVLAQQLADGEGFIYTPESGAVPLPRSERENLQRTFFSGSYAILPSVVHDAASVTRDSAFLDGSADRIDLVTSGVEHAIFLDDACTIVGDYGIDPDLGEVYTRYLEHRDVDGVLMPVLGELYAMGMLFGAIETLSSAVNVPIDEARFEVP